MQEFLYEQCFTEQMDRLLCVPRLTILRVGLQPLPQALLQQPDDPGHLCRVDRVIRLEALERLRTGR
jgi:hypothetical protein